MFFILFKYKNFVSKKGLFSCVYNEKFGFLHY